MSLFFVPAEAAQAAGTGSVLGPDVSGFYMVEILAVEQPDGPNFKEGTLRLRLRFDSGDEYGELITAGYDGEGRIVGGIDEKKAVDRTKFINGIMLKLGWTKEQIAGGYDDTWFPGCTAGVEWHAAADLGAQYGRIARWMDANELEKARASGRKPLVGRAGAPRGAPNGSAGGPRPGPQTGPGPQAAPAPVRPPAPAPQPPAPAPATTQRVAPRPPAPPTVRGV